MSLIDFFRLKVLDLIVLVEVVVVTRNQLIWSVQIYHYAQLTLVLLPIVILA